MANTNNGTNASPENLSAFDLLRQLETDLGGDNRPAQAGAEGEATADSAQKPSQAAVRPKKSYHFTKQKKTAFEEKKRLEKMASEISAYVTDDMSDKEVEAVIRRYLSGELGKDEKSVPGNVAVPEKPAFDVTQYGTDVFGEDGAAAEEPDASLHTESLSALDELTALNEQSALDELAALDEMASLDGLPASDTAPAPAFKEESTAAVEESLYLEEEDADYPEAILDLAAIDEREAATRAAAEQAAAEAAKKAEQEEAERVAAEQARIKAENAERAANVDLDTLFAEEDGDSEHTYEEYLHFLDEKEALANEAPDFLPDIGKDAPGESESVFAGDVFTADGGAEKDNLTIPFADTADGETDADALLRQHAEDLARGAGAFDKTDLDLMLAFGSEGDLAETVGADNADALRAQLAARREEQYQGMLSSGNRMRAASKIRPEYVSSAQNKEIFAAYKKRYGSLIARLFAGILFLLLLFLYENASLVGLSLPDAVNPQAYPVIFTLIDFQLVLLCVAPIFGSMCRGIKSFFTKEPTPASITGVAVILCAVYCIVICILSPLEAVHLYCFPVGLLAFMHLIYDILEQKREIMSFKIASSKKIKFAADPLNPQDAREEIDAFSEYLPDAPAMFKLRRCTFVDGFYARCDEYPRYQKILRAIYPVVFLAALTYGVAQFIMSANLYESVNTAFATAMLMLPASAFVVFGIPFYRASRRAFDADSAIIGTGSLTEYSDATVISFTDRDVFPSWGVKVRSVKVYGNNRIDHILYDAASVFGKLGGPLCDVFRVAAAELGTTENVVIRSTCDGGVEAEVDGKLILLGKASFMEQYGYKLSLSDEEQTMENTYETSVLFMANATEMVAKMYIQYSPDADFEGILKELYRQGMCVAIRTGDPNIDDGMLAAKINLSKYPVKVIRNKGNNEADRDISGVAIADRIDSGVISKTSAKGLLQSLALCEKVLRCIKRGTVLKIASILIGMLIMAAVVFFNHSADLPSAAIALYQLVFLLPTLLDARMTI